MPLSIISPETSIKSMLVFHFQMKRSTLFSLGCFFFLAPVICQAQTPPLPEQGDPLFYERTLQMQHRITPPLGGLKIDDYVVALSQSSGINFIADATRWDENARIGNFPTTAEAAQWTPTFSSVFADFESGAQVTDLRFEPKTYLMWERTDVRKMARLIVAQDLHKVREERPYEDTLRDALAHFVPLWMGGDTTAPTEAEAMRLAKLAEKNFHHIALKEFPVEVQNQLVALVRYGLLRPQWGADKILTDDFWKTAQLFLKKVPHDEDMPEGDPEVWIRSGEGDKAWSFQLEFWFAPYRESGAALPGAPEDAALVAHDENEAEAETPFLLAPLEKGLSWQQLNERAPLQAKISLQAKRLSLTQLFEQIQQKSGARLKLGERAPAPELRVTLGVAEMPLSTLLSALARTFNLSWSVQNEQLVANDDGSDELGKLVARTRQSLYQGDRTFNSGRSDQVRALADEVREVLGAEAKTEAAFESLSPDLQKRVRAQFEYLASDFLVLSYEGAYVYLQPDTKLILSAGREIGDPIRVTFQAAAAFRAQTSAELGKSFIFRLAAEDAKRAKTDAENK